MYAGQAVFVYRVLLSCHVWALQIVVTSASGCQKKKMLIEMTDKRDKQSNMVLKYVHLQHSCLKVHICTLYLLDRLFAVWKVLFSHGY